MQLTPDFARIAESIFVDYMRTGTSMTAMIRLKGVIVFGKSDFMLIEIGQNLSNVLAGFVIMLPVLAFLYFVFK